MSDVNLLPGRSARGEQGGVGSLWSGTPVAKLKNLMSMRSRVLREENGRIQEGRENLEIEPYHYFLVRICC